MANTLDLTVTLPSRVGHAPPVDGWTYHHVLPWRYYYLLGFIITSFAKFKLLNSQWLAGYRAPALGNMATVRALLEAQFNAAGEGEDRTRALRGMFGNWGNFTVDENPLILLRLAETLHGPGGNNVIGARIIEEETLDPTSLAALCTNPEFGGFAAMYPQQRIDDPHAGAEPRKPHSAPARWWTLIQQMKATLEAVAPRIENLPENRRVAISINATNRDLIIEQVTTLSTTYQMVRPFYPSDWDFVRRGISVLWTYIVPPDGFAGQGEIAPVFRLNTTGNGGTTTLHANAGTVPRGTTKVMRSAVAGQRDRMKFHSS